MFKYILSTLLVLLFLGPILSFAAEPDNKKVRFAYDLDFEMNFDNREYDPSKFSSSKTIFGARLSPAIGIAYNHDDKFNHRLMLGADIMQDFGASKKIEQAFRELLLYYNLQTKAGKNDISVFAGIFPRSSSDAKYDRAFFSDEFLFYDTAMEGLLVKFNRPKSYYEFGCDWMGMIGPGSRERFMLFSHGRGEAAKSITLAYSAYMYHFANSFEARGVVDNILISPSISFDAAAFLPLQKFSVELSWIQAFQQDRKFVGKFVFPGGGKLDIELRNWNVGLKNSLYYGKNLMPYYHSKDVIGDEYGSLLYHGDPFYMVRTDGANKPGLYDCLEVYYRPYVGRFLQIDISARFHFNTGSGFKQGYSGCQQVVNFKFNLQALLKRKK